MPNKAGGRTDFGFHTLPGKCRHLRLDRTSHRSAILSVAQTIAQRLFVAMRGLCFTRSFLFRRGEAANRESPCRPILRCPARHCRGAAGTRRERRRPRFAVEAGPSGWSDVAGRAQLRGDLKTRAGTAWVPQEVNVCSISLHAQVRDSRFRSA